MAKYRKKPVVVEANIWTRHGDNVGVHYYDPYGEVEEDCNYCKKAMQAHGWIETLEGGHIVCPGDYIITGVKGERYSCKPDIFKQTYEKVEEK